MRLFGFRFTDTKKPRTGDEVSRRVQPELLGGGNHIVSIPQSGVTDPVDPELNQAVTDLANAVRIIAIKTGSNVNTGNPFLPPRGPLA